MEAQPMTRDPRNYSGPEPQGLEIQPALPGYRYVLKNGDGTATCGWAPTRSRARQKSREVAD